MPLTRNEDGTWTLRPEDQAGADAGEFNPAYLEAVPRYATALDPAFTRARERSEFDFLCSLFRVRGVQDAGWDPYETTLQAIPAIVKVHEQVQDYEAARHLQLWIYGHILEASEPYELLANLIDVARGGRFRLDRFPPGRRGLPRSPGEKIGQLEAAAVAAGIPAVVTPLRENWNRDLRNAIFHAEYTLYGGEVRTLRPTHIYTHDEVMILVNRTLAYHNVLAGLFQAHIASYKELKVIAVPQGFSNDPAERAVVIVREGHGAVGLKHAWTRGELAAGKIPYRMGRFTREEIRLLDADPTLALLAQTSGGK